MIFDDKNHYNTILAQWIGLAFSSPKGRWDRTQHLRDSFIAATRQAFGADGIDALGGHDSLSRLYPSRTI